MTKRYIIKSPYQLKNIIQFCKSDICKMMNVARVWSSTQRQGITTWDGKIGISFRTDGRERIASVYRIGLNEQEFELVRLKYTPALKWCEENLSEHS